MQERYQAQLAGGHPALDFLNTVHDWTVEHPRDYLMSFADAIRFGQAAGLLTPGEARRLGRTRTVVELRRLHSLRGTLERIFRARVNGMSPRAADLASLASG